MEHAPEYIPFFAGEFTPPLSRASSASSINGDDLLLNEMSLLAEKTSAFRISESSVECSVETQTHDSALHKNEIPLLLDNPRVYPVEVSFGQNLYEEPASYLASTPDHVICDEPESYSNDDEAIESVNSTLNDHVLRRKALLIGISYEKNEDLRGKSLKGPHHDVDEVRKLLINVYGWTTECFVTLKDDDNSVQSQPTVKNIKCEIMRLVEGAQVGDQLFFYFSGHGGQVPDLDGDEDDGMDEVIFACDGGMIVDDELHDMLVKPLPTGCRLTALLDCCSSGTGLDLPYNFEEQKTRLRDCPLVRKKSEGDVVLLAACEDSQSAWEKRVGGERRTMGMLTQAFIKSLKTQKRSTYNDLLSSVRSQLQKRHTLQNPQLSSSRKIDMNDYFCL